MLIRLFFAFVSVTILAGAPIKWSFDYFGVPFGPEIAVTSPQVGLLQVLSVITILFLASNLVIVRRRNMALYRCSATLILVVILELGLNARLSPSEEVPKVTSTDAELGWVWVPLASKTNKTDSGSHLVRYNSLGLRGREFSMPVRRMFLGNSITQGQHVAEEEVFSHILGGVNAGFDGYNTLQARDRYKRDLKEYEPEILFLVVSVVDVVSEAMNKKRIEETLKNNLTVGNEKESYSRYLWEWVNGMALRRSLLLEKKENAERKDRWYLAKSTAEFDILTWKEWTSSILELADLASESRFVAVLSPPTRGSQGVQFQ